MANDLDERVEQFRTRPLDASPYGAQRIASASAGIRVLMNVVSIERNRSSDAEARCSCKKREGSILLGAVIA